MDSESDLFTHTCESCVFSRYKYTGQVGLGVGAWTSNLTNPGSIPSEFVKNFVPLNSHSLFLVGISTLDKLVWG